MQNNKKKKAGRPPSKPVSNRALMKAINIVGSINAFSLETGISKQSISKWLYDPSLKIPAHQVSKIVIATNGKIRPEELRSDITWQLPPHPEKELS